MLIVDRVLEKMRQASEIVGHGITQTEPQNYNQIHCSCQYLHNKL